MPLDYWTPLANDDPSLPRDVELAKQKLYLWIHQALASHDVAAPPAPR